MAGIAIIKVTIGLNLRRGVAYRRRKLNLEGCLPLRAQEKPVLSQISEIEPSRLFGIQVLLELPLVCMSLPKGAALGNGQSEGMTARTLVRSGRSS